MIIFFKDQIDESGPSSVACDKIKFEWNDGQPWLLWEGRDETGQWRGGSACLVDVLDIRTEAALGPARPFRFADLPRS